MKKIKEIKEIEEKVKVVESKAKEQPKQKTQDRKSQPVFNKPTTNEPVISTLDGGAREVTHEISRVTEIIEPEQKAEPNPQPERQQLAEEQVYEAREKMETAASHRRYAIAHSQTTQFLRNIETQQQVSGQTRTLAPASIQTEQRHTIGEGTEIKYYQEQAADENKRREKHKPWDG